MSLFWWIVCHFLSTERSHIIVETEPRTCCCSKGRWQYGEEANILGGVAKFFWGGWSIFCGHLAISFGRWHTKITKSGCHGSVRKYLLIKTSNKNETCYTIDLWLFLYWCCWLFDILIIFFQYKLTYGRIVNWFTREHRSTTVYYENNYSKYMIRM